MHILRTVLYNFPKMQTRGILFTIKSFSRWPFPFFSSPKLFQGDIVMKNEMQVTQGVKGLTSVSFHLVYSMEKSTINMRETV